MAVVLGFFLLGGVPFSLLNVSGIALNTAGAVWYTAIKYMEKERDRQGGRVGGSGVGAAGSQMMVGAVGCVGRQAASASLSCCWLLLCELLCGQPPTARFHHFAALRLPVSAGVCQRGPRGCVGP